MAHRIIGISMSFPAGTSGAALVAVPARKAVRSRFLRVLRVLRVRAKLSPPGRDGGP
jgi:hypothetical protein